MTVERTERTVESAPSTDGPAAVRTETRSTSTSGPGGPS